LTLFISVSNTTAGSGGLAAASVPVAPGFDVVITGGSFELQLEMPNAAINPNTITVATIRSGLQNLIAPGSFVFNAIAFTASCRI
jgi:hypothetical protein